MASVAEALRKGDLFFFSPSISYKEFQTSRQLNFAVLMPLDFFHLLPGNLTAAE
jgi:hypothetical protein